VPTSIPSERCFTKLKAIAQAARCRSIDTLWPLLGQCVPRFRPEVPQSLSALRVLRPQTDHENRSGVTRMATPR